MFGRRRQHTRNSNGIYSCEYDKPERIHPASRQSSEKAPGKEFAEIYDFVTLPRPLDSVSAMTEDQAKRDMALVRNELARIKEFGRLSMNPMDAESLIWEIQDAYHITSDEPDEEEF